MYLYTIIIIIKKDFQQNAESLFLNGRDDTIRTCDPLVPSEVRYQTALHPDIQFSIFWFASAPPVLPLRKRDV